ncbi:hypothetical protein MKX01_040028 [Papaver californicum]|nr:hypothetical protein MKX01_040028 [Papaver californicum]
MAKPAHLSLSPKFLIGVFLVLIVADTTYVCGEFVVGNSVSVKACSRSNCDSLCRIASNFLVSHTECEIGALCLNRCLCCR